jgi:hypothetical protein
VRAERAAKNAEEAVKKPAKEAEHAAIVTSTGEDANSGTRERGWQLKSVALRAPDAKVE